MRTIGRRSPLDPSPENRIRVIALAGPAEAGRADPDDQSPAPGVGAHSDGLDAMLPKPPNRESPTIQSTTPGDQPAPAADPISAKPPAAPFPWSWPPRARSHASPNGLRSWKTKSPCGYWGASDQAPSGAYSRGVGRRHVPNSWSKTVVMFP